MDRNSNLFREMRNAVVDMAMEFSDKEQTLVDLGMGPDRLLKPFIDIYQESCSYLGIAATDAQAAEEKAFFGNPETLTILQHDLGLGLPNPDKNFDLAFCSFSFYNLSVTYRHHLLHQVRNSLRKGGAFFLIEPVVANTAELEKLIKSVEGLWSTTSRFEQERETDSLLDPKGESIPADWNTEWLLRAGFKNVECFWRVYDTAAWVAF